MISVDAWVPGSAFKTNCFQCSQDWDKPENIPDPDAKKPEDWDEDMDGEWEPAMIPNPEYKVKMSTLADVFMLQSCADCWYFYNILASFIFTWLLGRMETQTDR